MAVRARMHPRNIYRNPPNFKELAIEYPEFRKYVKQELSGRMTLDYTDRKSLAELAKLLLLKDFDLKVEINMNRLIPRVPLCLNYLLWVEDLLSALEKSEEINGIDIGTGSVCIYSLLASTKGWKMLATEIDRHSYENASENIKRNNLNNKITLRFVENSDQILEGVIDDNSTYDFCMCNPPFFDNDETPRNRTSRRRLIDTSASQVHTDVITKGGEVEFVKKIITESTHLREKIKIYTTLVGKKSDFVALKKEINKMSDIVVAVSEFCQGNTTRWGIAWSYLNLNLQEVCNSHLARTKKTKSKVLIHTVVAAGLTLDKASERIQHLLKELKISYVKGSVSGGCSYTLKAYENTWSHQRKKKRLKKNELTELKSEKTGESTNSMDDGINSSDSSDNCDPPSKKVKLEGISCKEGEADPGRGVLVECLILLRKENVLTIEMSWLSGHKESVHQIFQFIKNNFMEEAGKNLNVTE